MATERPERPERPELLERRDGYEIAVSAGELLDRITVLRIKEAKGLERGDDDGLAAAAVARRHLHRLERVWAAGPLPEDEASLEGALHGVNSRLWDLEDEVRRAMAVGDDAAFVTAARSVPVLNDLRAHLKANVDRAVRLALGDAHSRTPLPSDPKLYSLGQGAQLHES